MDRKIVLCSASPRRKQLLKKIGLDFEILVKDVEESFSSDLKEEEIAVFLALKKAAVFKKDLQPGKIYLTADTIVWLNNNESSGSRAEKGTGGEMLGKPVDATDAFNMLKKLSNRIHQVYTGICLSSLEKCLTFYVRSDVQFREMIDDEIKYYIQHYHPFDKAGSYGAQECLPENMNPCSEEEIKFLKSIHKENLFEKTMMKDKKHMPIIKKINGSYFNVMGLPVVEVWEQLAGF